MRNMVLPTAIAVVLAGTGVVRAATKTATFSVSVVVLEACSLASPTAVAHRATGRGTGAVCTAARVPGTATAPDPVVTYTHDVEGGPAILTVVF